MSETAFTKLFKRMGFVPQDDMSQNLATGFYPSPFDESQLIRRKQYDLYWNYYKGEQRPPLKIDDGQPDLNQIENYCMAVVDMSRRFLIGDGVAFETDDTVADENVDEQTISDAEALLTAVINHRVQVDVAQAGCITGVPALRIFPQGEGNPPRVVVVDPAGLEIFTGADIDKVDEYRQTWWDGQYWQRHRMLNRNGQNDQDGNEMEGWEIIAEYRRGDLWEEISRESWDYFGQPMYHAQNTPLAFSIYGMSDLAPASLQDAINRTSSDIQKILFHHAAPFTIVSGGASHKLIVNNNAGARLMKTPDGVTVSNLEMQSDLAASEDHRNNSVNAFYSITGTPRMDAEQVQLGAVSGFALQLSMMPALMKMNDKRLTYGGMFKGVAMAVLDIAGMLQDVEVIFPNPLPTDENERIARFISLVKDGGVDKYVAARQAGFDVEEAKEIAATSITLPTQSPISALLQSTEV